MNKRKSLGRGLDALLSSVRPSQEPAAPDEPAVAASVRMKDRSAAEVFGELRERKNKS